jgi:hypothetical protein
MCPPERTPGIGGETMTPDDQRRKLELVVETAREVWGVAGSDPAGLTHGMTLMLALDHIRLR